MKGRDGCAVGDYDKFRLLMWKNFLQQLRHRTQTAVELLLIFLTLALVLILRSKIPPTKGNLLTYPPISPIILTDNSKKMIDEGMDYLKLMMTYSPRNSAISRALFKAINKLYHENYGYFYGMAKANFNSSTLKLYHPFSRDLVGVNLTWHLSTKTLVRTTEERTKRYLTSLEFDDNLLDTGRLPIGNLRYTLRMPEKPRMYAFFGIGSESWYNDLSYPRFQVPGPRFPHSDRGGDAPGYVDEMFIALQHSISMSLIEVYTGRNLKSFKVSIQRLPYPPHVMDLAVEILKLLLPLLIVMGFSYTAVNIVRDITVEKELQLKETMKRMGIPTWLHWTAWFCKQFIYLLVVAIFIVIILKFHWFTAEEGFSDYAVFTDTPWSVLFFFFMLYLTCMISFCFMLSGFFSKGSSAALITGVVWFLTLLPAVILAMDAQVSTTTQTLLCLSINSAMAFGFQLLFTKDRAGGTQWGDFWDVLDLNSNRFQFGSVVGMLVIDCVLYMLVALYLDQILPGPHAVAKPWYFLIQKKFWYPKSNVMADDTKHTQNILMEKLRDEPTIGVKTTNLTKVYGKHVAVNNLSLDVYNGQVTFLLGHNGAGKSTVLYMLIGNTKITSGSAWVVGYDISQQAAEARANVGFCPQYNVLFDYLTVREHLEFFATLKGSRADDLSTDVDTLISKLVLDQKNKCMPAALSECEKRRLSVGIALCGAPQVLLLDEPTSGMDPSSRRALWDLLQKEKAGRSIIVTTHFMDEADILGDRLAIMSGGRLQCVGSPCFLKRHYGRGYTLVVVKSEGFQLDTCTQILKRHVPEITIKEDRGTEVAYALTNTSYKLQVFEAMLTDLEANKDTIKYKHFGLTVTTLEDVFMAVGSEVLPHRPVSKDKTRADINIFSTAQTYNERDRRSGRCLLLQHVLAVWLKLWLIWSRTWPNLLVQLFVPLLVICSTLGIIQVVISMRPRVISRELTLAKRFAETETILAYNGTDPSSLGAKAYAAYKEMFESRNITTMKITDIGNTPVDDYYLNRTTNPYNMLFLRKRMLTGVTFGDDEATAWFSNIGYHDVAISLNAVHQAILKGIDPRASLSVYHHPHTAFYLNQSTWQPFAKLIGTHFASGIGISMSIVSAVFVMFYIKERFIRALFLQKIAGIHPLVVWGSAAVFDWVWFAIICSTIIIAGAAFGVVGFTSGAELGRVYLALIVYGAAMLPLHYLMSYLFDSHGIGFVVMLLINILFGLPIVSWHIVEALLSPDLKTEHEVPTALDNILQFFPLYSLLRSVQLLITVGMTEWTCLLSCNHLMHPLRTNCTVQTMCNPDIPRFQAFLYCCRREGYFDWEKPGILRYLTCMLVSCVFFWTLIICIECKVFKKVFYKTGCAISMSNRMKTPPPLNESSMDADVVAEIRHAEQVSATNTAQLCLVTKGLSKYYGEQLVVNQLSFTVADAEVFGLLGVNGSGKTTTYKMLVGDETISSGDAFISGYSVKEDIASVHKNISYCPQLDAIFGELTGRETLWLFMLLNGLPMKHASTLADSFGFTQHLDKKIDHYSGGNKRKLSTAIALLGCQRLLLMDEPTKGVDPASKRQVWRAIGGARRAGRGVVLTSHSMEECDALCSRLAIMVDGNFQCLGTPQHLKDKFSEGYTLVIKMKKGESYTGPKAASRGVPAMKRYIKANFVAPQLMEEYQGMLTYYLSDQKIAWSTMFGVMERSREYHDIDDYHITQTTLEQIFLQFTKYQREALKLKYEYI